jgi:hypothetical protein
MLLHNITITMLIWFDALMRDNLPGKGARGNGRGGLYNGAASFFLYLKDACVGGGTEFPDFNLDELIIVCPKKRDQLKTKLLLRVLVRLKIANMAKSRKS